MLLPPNGTLRAWGTTRTPYGTRWKSGAAFSMRKSQTGQREKWLIFESRWGGVRGQFQLAKWDPQLVAKTPNLGTPVAVVRKVHADIVQIAAQADLRERIAQLGLEASLNSPEEFAVAIKTDTAKWAKVIHAANIKAE